ncbi:MAG: RHS repeat protein, partial [Chloroflexi bacterium]|nr:RHS repeat protein [Chloroflexota bacterium]
MGWQARTTFVLVAVFIATALAQPGASAPLAQVPPLPSATPEPPLGVLRPLRKVPRRLMPPSFASDALSAVDAIFGPQRYGAAVGDPIDVGSGAYTFTATDLSVRARGASFTFARAYNSADDSYEPDGSAFVGAGFTHSYHWEIRVLVGASPCFATLRKGDGARDRIGTGTDPGQWWPASADYAACAFDGATATLTLRDQSRYVFAERFEYTDDCDSGCLRYRVYRPSRIELPSGDRLRLGYAPSPAGAGRMPVLATVTDTVGRTFTFSYDAQARLARVQDPSGRAATFIYDGLSRMVAATDPTGATTTYAYDGTSRHIATYTDPDGRVRATNVYGAADAVTQQTDGEGGVTTRSVNGGVEVTDPRGTRTSYSFDASGLSQERLWTDATTFYDTVYKYDTWGNRSNVTDRLGNVTGLVYEARARGNLLRRTDPAVGGTSPVTTYEYNSKNDLTRITDPRGFTTERTYDPSTNVLLTERRQIDAATYATTTYAYADPANPGLPTAITGPRGSVTALQYDAAGNLVRKTDPDGNATTYAYDALGRQTTVIDPEGHATTTAYDAADRVTSVADALGHVTQYAYDLAGNKTAVTDRRGNVTFYTYDRNARLISVRQSPAAGVTYTTSLLRDGNGNVTRITAGNGTARDSAYDRFDKVISTSETTADGVLTTTYTRDALGNVLTRSTPAPPAPPPPPPNVVTFRAASSAHNGAGATSLTVPRPAGTQAGDVLVAFVYAEAVTVDTPSGWTLIGTASYASHLGRAYWRRASAGDPATVDFTFGWGYFDGEWFQRSAAAIAAVLAYAGADSATPLSPSTASTNSGGGTQVVASALTTGYPNETVVASYGQYAQSTAPSPAGWTARVSAASGGESGDLKVEEWRFSAAGWTGTVSWSSPTSARWAAFLVAVNPVPTPPAPPPPGPTVTTYTYDALSRLTSVSAPGVAIDYTYDLAGNRLTMGDATGITTYAYDGAGRLVFVGSSAGNLTYVYDPDGDRTRLDHPGAGSVTYAYTPGGRLSTVTDWAGRVTTYAYRPSGLVASVTYPNGMVASYDYDAAGRLVSLVNAVGATTVSSHAYSLDNEGNRTQNAEFVAGITAPGSTDAILYSYDGLNRLTGSSGALGESFAFDGGSNITSRSGPSATYTYDQADRLQSDGTQTYGWSLSDQLTSRGPDTFAYDALDRLTSATVAGSTATYTYAGDGLLATRGGTAYLWDRSRDPAPILQVGSDRIVHGLGPLYLVKGDGTTTTLARDGLGSVRA